MTAHIFEALTCAALSPLWLGVLLPAQRKGKPDMGTTSDRNDPRLTHGPDSAPTGQAPVYLVLSDEERAKGFIRPVRRTYVHRYMLDGSRVPTVLTSLEGVGGCGTATTMGQAIAETYAREPGFYGATYCVGCRMHLPVAQFHWDDGFETVGS